MINLDVKTTWNGQVAIRDKYVIQAKNEKKDICITCGGRRMTIGYKDIDKKTTGMSKPMEDRFSNHTHRLVYFVWKPNVLDGEELTRRMCGY
jgi:hypothetical protein